MSAVQRELALPCKVRHEFQRALRAVQCTEIAPCAGCPRKVQGRMLAALQHDCPCRADDGAEATGRAAVSQRQPTEQLACFCLLLPQPGRSIEAEAPLDLRFCYFLQPLGRRVEQSLEKAAPFDLPRLFRLRRCRLDVDERNRLLSRPRECIVAGRDFLLKPGKDGRTARLTP